MGVAAMGAGGVLVPGERKQHRQGRNADTHTERCRNGQQVLEAEGRSRLLSGTLDPLPDPTLP